MPELPEIETLLNGLKIHIEGITIQNVVLRHHQLRWPIPENLNDCLVQQEIGVLSRRGKYLLIPVVSGTLIVHLGMSGSLQIVSKNISLKKHDHMDIILSNHSILRYNDPRRFGAILWTNDNPLLHPLLKNLGVEPLSTDFTPEYLINQAKRRRISIKQFIMDGNVVVGVGNIYAAESLFMAGIHPLTEAGHLSMAHYNVLVTSIQKTLQSAINQGGTTLKDFVNSEGKPGYFSQKLMVYGRSGKLCYHCNAILSNLILGQRSTVFCPTCQLRILK